MRSRSPSVSRACHPTPTLQPGAATRRRGQRPPIDSGSGSSGGGGGAGGGGGGADMEYEAEFVDGVMVRHDAAQLRLAALRCVGGTLLVVDAGCALMGLCAPLCGCAFVRLWSTSTEPSRFTGIKVRGYAVCVLTDGRESSPHVYFSGCRTHGVRPTVGEVCSAICGCSAPALAGGLACLLGTSHLFTVAVQDADFFTLPSRPQRRNPTHTPHDSYSPMCSVLILPFFIFSDSGGLRSDAFRLSSERRKTPCRGCA